MTVKARLRLCLLLTLLAADQAVACPAASPLFCDDFNSSTLDKAKWNIGTWKLGRTQLGITPNIVTEPATSTSFARLRFETYKFKGTEIWSVPTFSLNTFKKGFSFKARVRQGPLPSGLVTSFFTYNYDSLKKVADEIDIEVLTKNLSNSASTNPAQFTTWNDWASTSSYSDPNRYYSQTKSTPLKMSDWHIYEMRWTPTQVDWFVDNLVTPVATSVNAIPNMDTYIRLNFWAPASSWTAAYDPNLKVTNIASANQIYNYDVDWVQVTALP